MPVKPYYKGEFSYFAHNFGKSGAIWLKFAMTHSLKKYIPLMMIGFSWPERPYKGQVSNLLAFDKKI